MSSETTLARDRWTMKVVVRELWLRGRLTRVTVPSSLALCLCACWPPLDVLDGDSQAHKPVTACTSDVIHTFTAKLGHDFGVAVPNWGGLDYEHTKQVVSRTEYIRSRGETELVLTDGLCTLEDTHESGRISTQTYDEGRLAVRQKMLQIHAALLTTDAAALTRALQGFQRAVAEIACARWVFWRTTPTGIHFGQLFETEGECWTFVGSAKGQRIQCECVTQRVQSGNEWAMTYSSKLGSEIVVPSLGECRQFRTFHDTQFPGRAAHSCASISAAGIPAPR